MKKILFLVSSIATSGGIQKNLSIISDELSKKGYRISILSVFETSKLYYEFNNNIKHYSAGIIKTTDIKKYIFKTFMNVNKKLKEIDFDVLVIEGTGYANFVKTKWYKSKKVIVVDHEGLQFHSKFGLSRFGAIKAVKHATSIRVLTNISKNEYHKIFRKYNPNVIRIANPINNNIKCNPYDKYSKKILYVGRLSKEKGIKFLIEAIIKLNNNNQLPEGWKIDIFGEGELHDEIDAQIKRYNLNNIVKLKGFHNNISEIYSEYSFLVLPSLFESFGLVIVEALKSGIPIVAFNGLYGPKEIIKNMKNGLLVERGNSEKLAEAMGTLIESNELREKLSLHTNDYLEEYNIDIIINKWIQLIE